MIKIVGSLPEQILEAAENMLGTRDLEILRVIDVGWAGWEPGTMAALVATRDGRMEIVIVADVSLGKAPAAVFRERIEYYQGLVNDAYELIYGYQRGRKGPEDDRSTKRLTK